MKTVYLHISLVIVFLILAISISRLIDFIICYHNGISPTQIVDPLLLSIRQLKYLLEIRGISNIGYLEKKELAHLVTTSGHVVQSEVEEIPLDSQQQITTVSSNFSRGSHLIEEVEDSKDSIWLVQIITKNGKNKQLLDDSRWQWLCKQVAPFDIKTGIFNCDHDKRMCGVKGWKQPMLILALPRGTKAKDMVVLKYSTSTKTQHILEWIRNEISHWVYSIKDSHELERDWLPTKNISSKHGNQAVKIILLSHLLHPPLFFAALSIKYSGRVKFGMLTLSQDDPEQTPSVLKNLKSVFSFDLTRLPTYIVITPETLVLYGQRKREHFNFNSMHAFLRSVQPETNDVFFFSFILVNMFATFRIFQISMCFGWKYIVISLTTLVIFNLCAIAAWLLVHFLFRFTLFTLLTEGALVILRYVTLTDLGALIHAEWQMLMNHPVILFCSFFLYAFFASWLIKKRYSFNLNSYRDQTHNWCDLIPVDGFLFDCFFRSYSISRQPPVHILREDGVDLLIERLAVPHFWLHPIIDPAYIKNLPLWKYKSPDPGSPEHLQNMMDSKDYLDNSDEQEDSTCEDEEEDDLMNLINDPPRWIYSSPECSICLERYNSGNKLCGLPCGHCFHAKCIMPWLLNENEDCPICRWPAYRKNNIRSWNESL